MTEDDSSGYVESVCAEKTALLRQAAARNEAAMRRLEDQSAAPVDPVVAALVRIVTAALLGDDDTMFRADPASKALLENLAGELQATASTACPLHVLPFPDCVICFPKENP